MCNAVKVDYDVLFSTDVGSLRVQAYKGITLHL